MLKKSYTVCSESSGSHYRLPMRVAEQKGGSPVYLPDSSVHLVPSSVHSALRTLVDERFLGRKKVSNILMEETILILCSGYFLTLDQLADLLKRSPETIRTHYLNQMVKRKLLDLKYPDKLTHPDQGYRTRK